jgi:DNA-binding transcriptional LysR family regulator
VQEVAETQTVIGLVAAGVGVSLVPESVRALVRAGVTYRPLDGEAPKVRLTMAWRAADDSPVLNRFLEMARAAAPAEGERGRRGPARN